MIVREVSRSDRWVGSWIGRSEYLVAIHGVVWHEGEYQHTLELAGGKERR